MRRFKQQQGTTLVELMVALAIGSFLMIGAVQIYNQSRQAFVVNDSIARVQETAQFAMDIIEQDIRMASNWGRTSRSLAIEGRSIAGNENPSGLTVPATCGVSWVLNLAMPVDGNDDTYNLACGPTGTAMADSDVVTVRRAAVIPTVGALDPGRLYVQTTRVQGELFDNATIPADFSGLTTCPSATPGVPCLTSTHEVRVNSYYVATDSALIPGSPALRRKTLQMTGGGLNVVDEEVAPGVENLQVQFGIDTDGDNTVDRYVNPGSAIFDPAQAGSGYIPGARALTARIWLVVRGTSIEVGIQDDTDYEPGNVDLGVPADQFRRMQVSKTILLRNART